MSNTNNQVRFNITKDLTTFEPKLEARFLTAGNSLQILEMKEFINKLEDVENYAAEYGTTAMPDGTTVFEIAITAIVPEEDPG